MLFRGCGAGEDGLRAAGEDDFCCGEQGGENLAHFAFAAAGQEREEIRVARFVAENFQLRGHGMTDKIRMKAGFFVEIFFERKDAEHAVEPAGHAGNAGAVPGPDLGTDVVEELSVRALRLQRFGQTQVEAGVIDEENGIGFCAGDAIKRFVEFSAEVAVVPENIPEADHGGVVGPVFDFRAHGVEFWSAQAGDLKVGVERFKFRKQRGGMGVAARFAGYDENAH